MIRRFAPLVLAVGAVLGATEAKAAIFRINEENPPALNGTSVTSYQPGSFENIDATPIVYKISGDFRVETSYLRSDGTVNNTTSQALTAWNIVVQQVGGTSFTFRRGYSDQLGLADNSITTTAAPLANSFTVCTTTDGTACNDQDTLTLTFANTFEATISNSVGGASGQSTFLNTVAYRKAGNIVTVNQTNINAQADFVPLAPGLLSLATVPYLFTRLKNNFSC